MTTTTLSINPYYAARTKQAVSTRIPASKAGLRPASDAPRNASPVPHLTSLYHFHRAGEYGDRSWPGNCGGNLIKDLLTTSSPGHRLRPDGGSGTCRDVCEELGIPCMAWDIHHGQDACDPQRFGAGRRSTSSGLTRPTGGKSFTPTMPATCHERRRSSISCGDTASSSATVPVR